MLQVRAIVYSLFTTNVFRHFVQAETELVEVAAVSSLDRLCLRQAQATAILGADEMHDFFCLGAYILNFRPKTAVINNTTVPAR